MRRLTLLCTMFVLLALPLTALAQRPTGDLRGVVTDESGAVLPGVTVTIRGRAVPGAPTTVTNESGVYRFPNLPPGSYDVTVELAGFATQNQTGVPVQLGASAELNIQMKVSTQSETITAGRAGRRVIPALARRAAGDETRHGRPGPALKGTLPYCFR